MLFSSDQATALQKISDWLGTADPGVFTLFGCAGVGKTVCAQHIADKVEGLVLFAAYIGKAAHVLRQNGCETATTIHRLIYTTREKSRKRLMDLRLQLSNLPDDAPYDVAANLEASIQAEKEATDRPQFTIKTESLLSKAKLLIVDECSMINDVMWADLASFGTPILALGDPGQLPPVRGKCFFVRAKPDYLLTSVHRQALDSPILKLATLARKGERLEYGDYGDGCTVVRKATPELAMAADQIIVGRNATRNATNDRMRDLLGFGGPNPERGEKIICLRNNHDLGLMNGSLWEIQSIECFETDALMDITPHAMPGRAISVVSHLDIFRRDKSEDMFWSERKASEDFDYGYAITCHKSQGSQWDNVLIIDESRTFGDNANKHLYTAITRACKSVTVVRSPSD